MKQHFYLLLVAVLVLKSSSAFAQAGSDVVASGVADAGVPLVAEGFDPAQASSGLIKIEGLGKAWPEIKVKAEPDFAKVRKEIATYSESQKACRAKEDKANKFCIEARNPDVQKYAMFAQTIMAGVSGFTDSCSKFSKLMNMGNTALGLYQAQCGLWKGMCSSSCTAAVTAVNAAKANLKKISTTYVTESKIIAARYRAQLPLGSGEEAAKWYDKAAIDMPNYIQQYERDLLDRELAKGADYKPVAQKLETCNGYAKQLATSVLGAAGMLKSAAGADKCEEESSNNPTAVAGGAVDCTIPANKTSNMTCICLDAPRTPGCDSLLDSPTAAKNLDVARAASTSDYVPSTPSGGKIDLGGDGGGLDLASKSSNGGGSSSPGAPGGRAAGIDGGSAGGGGAGGSAAEKKSALNTNILSGEGGGGGGGSWGGGGGDDGLRQYLPGGAKDPAAQGVAGQGAGAIGVTGPAGKSNWEKVRDRYRDNNRTLLNN